MRGIVFFGGVFGASLLGAGSGCGGSNQAPADAQPIDGPSVQIDAAIDAAIDAPPDAPPDAPIRRYVLDKLTFPTDNAEALALALDLNGDALPDNQLGQVLAALSTQGLGVQGAVDAAVSTGAIVMLGQANVTDPAAATFTLFTGANPQPAPCNGAGDTVCRRHLDGTGSFEIAATSANDPPLTGTLVNGTLTAGSGALQVPLMFIGNVPVAMNLIGARVELKQIDGDSFGLSTIAGAITKAELDAKLYPAMHAGITVIVATDCTDTTPPQCGCAAGSTGLTMLSLFDAAPRNCEISLQELQDNSLLQSLLAPDVVIDGQQALSLGFGATAVQAEFTP